MSLAGGMLSIVQSRAEVLSSLNKTNLLAFFGASVHVPLLSMMFFVPSRAHR
jgi:hypothetical protein